MFDRLFDNAVDIHGRRLSLAVRDGRFIEVAPFCDASLARERIDLDGKLVLPGLVDGHIHLDKSFVGDRWQPHVPANSLRERLAIEKQQLASARPMVERADALIAQAASFGTIAMRCHVDVDATTGLSHLEAVMEARERWKGIVNIELVAFPQAGIVTCPG